MQTLSICFMKYQTPTITYINECLTHLNICNKNVISTGYEHIALNSLEDDGYHGFFISDVNMKIIYAFVIMNEHARLIGCAEIILFCANSSVRVPYLATRLLNVVIFHCIPLYIPDCTCVMLTLGTKDSTDLHRYYSKFGFKRISNTSDEMRLNLRTQSTTMGGKKKKQTRK